MSAVAVISGVMLLHGVIYLIIAGVIFWLLTWALSQLPIPEPFKTVIRVVLILAIVVILLNFLFWLMGAPFIVW